MPEHRRKGICALALALACSGTTVATPAAFGDAQGQGNGQGGGVELVSTRGGGSGNGQGQLLGGSQGQGSGGGQGQLVPGALSGSGPFGSQRGYAPGGEGAGGQHAGGQGRGHASGNGGVLIGGSPQSGPTGGLLPGGGGRGNPHRPYESPRLIATAESRRCPPDCPTTVLPVAPASPAPSTPVSTTPSTPVSAAPSTPVSAPSPAPAPTTRSRSAHRHSSSSFDSSPRRIAQRRGDAGFHVAPLLAGPLVTVAVTPSTTATSGPSLLAPGGTGSTSPAAALVPQRTPDRPTASGPSVIERFVNVVPGVVWLVLGISLLLAAVGGGAALWSGQRVRRQAGDLAAVSAAAVTDPLTGVLNRRGFIEEVERELARARRYERRFVLAYVDVRGLKVVNDSEGHLAGDELLASAAHLLRDCARADDVVGRLGGDEMGLLLVEQGPEGATAVINRIGAEVEARRGAIGIRSPWELTIGTAAYPSDGSTVTDLLAVADRRLYEQRGIALR